MWQDNLAAAGNALQNLITAPAYLPGYTPPTEPIATPSAGSAAAGQVGPMAQAAGTEAYWRGALAPLMSGQVNDEYLGNASRTMFADATRNLLENVMPGISSGFQAAGQMGSSRQGIAQGLAASRMNQDLSGALAQMYLGAHEGAQNRAASLGGQLAGLDTNVGIQNAQMTNQGAITNAQMATQAGIANAQMATQASIAAAQQRMQQEQLAQQYALGLGGLAQSDMQLRASMAGQLGNLGLGAGQLQANTYAQMLPYLTAPGSAYTQGQNAVAQIGQQMYDAPWSALGNLSGVANPLLGSTGGVTNSQSAYIDPIAGALGGALSGVQLAQMLAR